MTNLLGCWEGSEDRKTYHGHDGILVRQASIDCPGEWWEAEGAGRILAHARSPEMAYLLALQALVDQLREEVLTIRTEEGTEVLRFRWSFDVKQARKVADSEILFRDSVSYLRSACDEIDRLQALLSSREHENVRPRRDLDTGPSQADIEDHEATYGSDPTK